MNTTRRPAAIPGYPKWAARLYWPLGNVPERVTAAPAFILGLMTVMRARGVTSRAGRHLIHSTRVSAESPVNAQRLIVLAVQISIAMIVFDTALRATPRDASH